MTWRTIGTAVCAALVVALLAAACHAGIVVDGLVRERVAEPGETYTGIITIRNAEVEPRAARLYQKDYLFYSDGSNIYGEPGTDERSNASWMSLSGNYVEVPGESSVAVRYTVSVPPDKSLRGSYWSLLMIEELPTADADAASDNASEQRSSVMQVLRYGVQMVTHIGGTGQTVVKFADRTLVQTEDGTRMLLVDVENTGERSLRPNLWVELYDSSGIRQGRFESEKRRLYPGTSVKFAVDLTAAPEGSYQALVVVDNGDEHVFGAQYGMDF
jgi:hypothetical protein